MKKVLLFIALSLGGLVYADVTITANPTPAVLPLPPGDTNYLQISTGPTTQGGGFNVQSSTVAGHLVVIGSITVSRLNAGVILSTALTSGRIPFATTGGKLVDRSDVTMGATGIISAPGFTGALNGTLGTTTPAAATVTTLTIGGSGGGSVIEGTYTPSASGGVNLTGTPTMSLAHYSRVGNVVTVGGRFTAQATLAATATSFIMTLPFTTGIAAAEDATGNATCGNIVSMSAEIIGDVSGGTSAKVFWKSSDITSQSWSYTLTFRIQPAI